MIIVRWNRQINIRPSTGCWMIFPSRVGQYKQDMKSQQPHWWEATGSLSCGSVLSNHGGHCLHDWFSIILSFIKVNRQLLVGLYTVSMHLFFTFNKFMNWENDYFENSRIFKFFIFCRSYIYSVALFTRLFAEDAYPCMAVNSKLQRWFQGSSYVKLWTI